MYFNYDPELHLSAIAAYVSQRASIPQDAKWDCFTENDSETVHFRLADRSEVPFHGYVVVMDASEAAFKTNPQMEQLVGDVFVEILRQGLPEKTPRQPYPGIMI